MNKTIKSSPRKSAVSLLRSATLALVGLAACGAASAATLQIESANGYFLAEAFPDGAGYQYAFSATPNLYLDYQQGNAISGTCALNQGNGTITVTVTYPNGHIESAQRGVYCGRVGRFGN